MHGCEYQNYAHSMLFDCPHVIDTKALPFFPAPENAPGICSCNFGAADIETIDVLYNQVATCNKTNDGIRDGIGRQLEKACLCCGQSIAISL